MRIDLGSSLAKLPLPATDRWPDGVFDVQAFAHGTMSVILFAPRGTDHQTFHSQDELYVVLRGSGVLKVADERHAFGTGDVLFVPAEVPHRFESFTDDLQTWAIFWGPEGGESCSGPCPNPLGRARVPAIAIRSRQSVAEDPDRAP